VDLHKDRQVVWQDDGHTNRQTEMNGSTNREKEQMHRQRVRGQINKRTEEQNYRSMVNKQTDRQID